MLHGERRPTNAVRVDARDLATGRAVRHAALGRHNLASHAFIKGLDTEKVRRLGNWQTNAMVWRYQHLKPEFGKELANVMEFPRTKGTSSRTTKSQGSSKKTE